MRLTQVFQRQFKIARVYGIPVRIDYRWFAVVALSVWLIESNLQSHAMQLGNVRLPPLPSVTAWILGVLTTAGLFLSVFGHELSHALMARADGIAESASRATHRRCRPSSQLCVCNAGFWWHTDRGSRRLRRDVCRFLLDCRREFASRAFQLAPGLSA